MVVSLARRHTLLGCETKAMTSKSYENQGKWKPGSNTTCRIESMSRWGVIRLLDQIKTYHFPNFSCRHVLAILPSQVTPYTCKSKS